MTSERARDFDLQRAKGEARLVVEGAGPGVRVIENFQRAPVRVLFPRIERPANEAVFINTGGGIAGGDRFDYYLAARAGACLVATTQAAEKIYRALDRPARVTSRLRVASGAKLAWLPQETILFDGARLHRRAEIELSSGAELAALEWLVLGRGARGERMRHGEVIDGWRVSLGGRLLWADTFRIGDDLFGQLARRAILAESRAIATLIIFGPDPEGRLERARDCLRSLPCRAGATTLSGLLLLRFAAPEAVELRRALSTFLDTAGTGGSFHVPKMWSC